MIHRSSTISYGFRTCIQWLPSGSRQPPQNHTLSFLYGTYKRVSSTALTGNFAPLEHDMWRLLQATHTSPPSPLCFNIGWSTTSKKLGRLREICTATPLPEFGCLLEILHYLSIVSFQKRIRRKAETTILILGGMGDSHFSFDMIAL